MTGERDEVVGRYARLDKGRVQTCQPSRDEVVSGRLLGAREPRVIYPTQEAARAAAAELEGMGCDVMQPYPCRRSRRGHWHLATRVPPLLTAPQARLLEEIRAAGPEGRSYSGRPRRMVEALERRGLVEAEWTMARDGDDIEMVGRVWVKAKEVET